MKRSLSAFALAGVAALVLAAAPSDASAQDTGWWAPIAERLPATQGSQHPVCRDIPDLPACQSTDQRERERETRPEPRSRTTDRRDVPWGDGRADERADGRADGREDARRGGGPPFCRNGSGHPVHGRDWCREKGWGGGSGWEDASWEDVILGRRDGRSDRTGTLDRGGLLDVLGEVVLRRLERQGSQVASGALSGRLVEGRTRVLQVRAGDVPLAELLDADRDGSVDRVLLRTVR